MLGRFDEFRHGFSILGSRSLSCRFLALLLAGALLLSLVPGASAQAAETVRVPRVVRVFDNADLELSDPAGVAFSQTEGVFYITDVLPSGHTNLVRATPYERRLDSVLLAPGVLNPRTASFDDRTGRLVSWSSDTQDLVMVDVGPAGEAGVVPTVTHESASAWGLSDPQGVAVDPATGRRYLLDNSNRQIVELRPADLNGARPPGARDVISRSSLQLPGSGPIRGLAFNFADGHLLFLSPAEQRIYEVNRTGATTAVFDLSSLGLVDPQSLVVAPSGDGTDDADNMSVYVVAATIGTSATKSAALNESTGSESGLIVELALTAAAPLVESASTDTANLLRTTDLSLLSPPSPDSAGLAYLPDTNSLLISDSEVNEIPSLFTGDNLFRTTLAGNLIETLTTIGFSSEPTGVAYNATNGHLYVSDDDSRRVYEVNPGADGNLNTLDDVVTSFATTSFGCTDPEGIAFGSGNLFIADGLNEEIFVVDPGPNGVFDGVTSGDDVVTNFDVTSFGIQDPEGVEYANGYLYILASSGDVIAETTTSGSLLRYIDISSADPTSPAGLALAPRPAARRGRAST